jgi:SRSO17 transposase
MSKIKKNVAKSSERLPLIRHLPTNNLARRNEKNLAAELVAYQAVFAPLFTRSEQREWANLYMRGQLSDLGRKSIEPMVLQERGADPNAVRAVQQFISEGAWSDDAVLDRLQKMIGEDIGEDDGVMIVDMRGFPKKGDHSAGAAKQYCDQLGKIANCQQGVFVLYATRRGYTFVDRRLYMPEEWYDDAHADLRNKCRVPKDFKFKVESQLGQEMIEGLVGRGTLPFRWVVADERYGMNPAFLFGVAGLGKWYLVKVPEIVMVRVGKPTTQPSCEKHLESPGGGLHVESGPATALEIGQIPVQLPESAWKRYKLKEGTKKAHVVEFAFLRAFRERGCLPGDDFWVVLRRSSRDLRGVEYYLSNAPIDVSHDELVRASGLIQSVEGAIDESNSELGMDHYETRTWLGWNHHMTMVCLTHYFLVRLRLKLKNYAVGA